MRNALLCMSATANVVLLAILAPLPHESAPTARHAAVMLEPQTRCSDQAANAALSADLLAEAGRRTPLPPQYWAYTATTLHEHALAISTELASLRSEVLARCGPGARAAPGFAALFRPLGERFAFLTSEQQIAVHELKLELARERAAAAADATQRGYPRDASRQAGDASYREFLVKLNRSIGRDAAQQYLLRESPLATQLRSSGVRFDAATFRAAFEALQSLDRPELSPRAYLSGRQQLRAALGDRAFHRLSSQRDPRFAALRRVAQRAELTDAQLESVYGVLNDTQDAMLRTLGADDGSDPEQRAGIARQMRATMQRRVAEIVGAGAAETLIAAADEASLAKLRRPSDMPPPEAR